VCRIKNKFSFAKEDIVGGYRDLMIGVVFEDKSGLKIIGEIQIHDKFLYDLKSKVGYFPPVLCSLALFLNVCRRGWLK
jgi:hypothetical protein